MNKPGLPGIIVTREILEELEIPIRYAVNREQFSKIEQYYLDNGSENVSKDEVAVLAFYE